MHTLLIVEDEKMIRQGIAAMARRTEVPIETIRECRNGQEALELIRTEKIDAMFTDIKMPKMDGIALVDAMQECEHIPKTAVISGYDDFNYAVEMLKNGVIDYVLKPVKREKIQEVLRKMEESINQDRKQKQNGEKVLQHSLAVLLEGRGLERQEMALLEDEVRAKLGADGFRMALIGCSFGKADRLMAQAKLPVLTVEAEYHQTVWLLPGKTENEKVLEMEEEFSQEQIDTVWGASVLQSLEDMEKGMQELRTLRAESFVIGGRRQNYTEKKQRLPEAFAERFVQQFATGRMEQELKELHNLYFQSRHGSYEPQEILELIYEIRAKLEENYPDIVRQMKAPLEFRYLSDYQVYEEQQFQQMKRLLRERIDVDRNQEKVYQAIEYIKNHYATDLNMATVSNHVSMNYSLFSIIFKEYTGVNFVNYLKNLRIQEARRMLVETDAKIQEISQKVGYENEKHFMKTFKAVSGVSPTEYRRTHTALRKL